MAEHDKSYKKLFSHPKMVEDLLRGFVHEEWIDELEFATLETVKDSFVSDNLKERHDDIIWRVRWGPEWLYIYLLLEFQSTIDPFMAVRLMVYIGLLYQYLIKAEKLKKNDRLPPVLPIVIYNGTERWDASKELNKLIADGPKALSKYRPRLRYLLIDEGSFGDAKLAAKWQNLVAALFRLENTRTEKDEKAIAQAIQKILVLLIDWLKEPELADLRRDIETWLLRVLLPSNVPSEEIPKVTELQEMNQMLYETIQGLYKDAEARGEARGKARGQAKMLIQLLETKFGPLKSYQKTKIQRFDEKTLFSCSQRFITANSVGEVIGKKR